jgi:predicted ArsR family transcriptional regulator
VLARSQEKSEFDATMREVGRELMQGHRLGGGDLRQRVAGASALLNELGGLTEVEEENGSYLIRSHGCPLAAATANHPEVCNALESMLSVFVGSQVNTCCDRYDRVRCCFEIPSRQHTVVQ